jgi:hypothetical protein
VKLDRFRLVHAAQPGTLMSAPPEVPEEISHYFEHDLAHVDP